MKGTTFYKNVSIEGQINKNKSWETQQIQLAGFLDALNFTHFCTFTTTLPIGLGSTRRIAEKLYFFMGGSRLSSIFWVAEKFEVREGYHFHALIRTPLRPVDIWNWYFSRYGRCQIIDNTLPERMLPASFYVSKYITKKVSDYDLYINPEHLNIEL